MKAGMGGLRGEGAWEWGWKYVMEGGAAAGRDGGWWLGVGSGETRLHNRMTRQEPRCKRKVQEQGRRMTSTQKHTSAHFLCRPCSLTNRSGTLQTVVGRYVG